MLGKVALVAGAGAAYLLRTPEGRARLARLVSGGAFRGPVSTAAAGPRLVDRRPQASSSDGAIDDPAGVRLLPDARASEIARAVSEEQHHPGRP